MGSRNAGAAGELTPELFAGAEWTDRDGRRIRHRGPGHAVRQRRRRHRLVRHRRLPAHRRRADRPHQGAVEHRPSVADLPVPDPGVADPACRSGSARTPRRGRTTSGASPSYALGRGVARPHRSGRWCTCSASRSSPTTGRRGRPRCSSRLERESRPHRATRRCWSRAWSGWSAGGAAAATSRSSPRRRAPRATKRVAYRSQLRAPRGRLPGPEVPARPAGVPGDVPATSTTWSTPTSRTSTCTRTSRPPPARSWCAAAASSPPGCCSG